MIDDNELVSLLSDPVTRTEGFSALVHQYSEPLYWKIRHVILNHEDTNDVLQNTFIKAWKSLDTFQGKSSMSTWLYRIAINEALARGTYTLLRGNSSLHILLPNRLCVK